MLSTYIPGFTNMLMQPEYIGGPARVNLPLGVRPSAPAIMAAPAAAPVAPVVPAAPPIMAAPAAAPAAAPSASAPYIPAVTPQLREASYTPQDMRTAGLLSERTMEPSEEFRRADPSFTRKISDSNTYYTDPATGFFYNPDASRVGQYFTTNRGGAATAKGASGFAEFNPNFEYRLVDKASGNVVYSGRGVEGLTGVQGAAQRFAQEQGDKGDWAVEQFDPATGQATTVARDTKPSNIVGLIADIALPIAGAILLPGVGGALGGALGTGLGAAGGSALSSIAQGRSLGDTLLRAGLSGVTAGGLSAISGAPFIPASSPSGAVGGAVAGGVAGANQMALAGLKAAGLQSLATPSITVLGNAAGAGLGSVAGGALGSAAGSALGAAATGGGQAPAPTPAPAPQPAQPRPPVEITPEGNLILTATPTGGALSAVNPLPIATAGAGALAQAAYDTLPDSVKQQIEQKQAEQEPEQEGLIEVTDNRVTPPSPLEQAAIAAASATPNLVYGGPEGQLSEIIADRDAQKDIDAATAASAVAGALPTGGILPSGQTPTDGEATLETDKSLLDKLKENLSVTDYLRLAGLGIGLLGGGGGGQGALGTIPGGLFGGSGIFGGSLPRPTLPGASTGFAPRTADDLGPKTAQDWYRYGYGPEQSFFSYVPKGEENKSQAYTGYALGGMAGGGEMRGMGGSSFAVNGPGTGRSDEIPAMLSDGEYVIDAETVALLGDGSSKAGADRLDQFSANVRKHKGRHLAKGDFSVNAKRPEKYLKGGRT